MRELALSGIVGCWLGALLVGASCEAATTAEEEPEVLVEELGLSHLGCLVLDGDNLYYTALEPTPGLVRLPVTGGQPQVVAPDVGDACFVLHEDTFYVAEVSYPIYEVPEGRILSVPLSGGVPTVLAEGVDAEKLVIQGDRIYMLGQGEGGITWMPLAGGTPEQLLDDPDPYIEDFVVDQEHVYYAAGEVWNNALRVKRVPLDGGEPVTVADRAGELVTALGLCRGSGCVAIAWYREGEEQCWLEKRSTDGGEATDLASWSGGRAHMLHVTDTHVYVSEDWVRPGPGGGGPVCNSRVLAVPIDGGKIEVIAEDQNSPGGMATRMGYVYWRNRGRGWPGDIPGPENCPDSQIARARAP